jgi:hypothetical protein
MVDAISVSSVAASVSQWKTQAVQVTTKSMSAVGMKIENKGRTIESAKSKANLSGQQSVWHACMCGRMTDKGQFVAL